MNLAKISLPQASENLAPNLRIAQRMRLEQSQLEGVDKRIQVRPALDTTSVLSDDIALFRRSRNTVYCWHYHVVEILLM